MGQHPAATGFGSYLREAIHAAGFATPTQFARRVGTDPSVILRWISGEQRPTIRSIERIAPVLGRTIHDMINAAYPDTMPPTENSAAGPDRAIAGSSTAFAATLSDGTPPAAVGPPRGAIGGLGLHHLDYEVSQMLAIDSPLSVADREELRAALERLLDNFRPRMDQRRSA